MEYRIEKNRVSALFLHDIFFTIKVAHLTLTRALLRTHEWASLHWILPDGAYQHSSSSRILFPCQWNNPGRTFIGSNSRLYIPAMPCENQTQAVKGLYDQVSIGDVGVLQASGFGLIPHCMKLKFEPKLWLGSARFSTFGRAVLARAGPSRDNTSPLPYRSMGCCSSTANVPPPDHPVAKNSSIPTPQRVVSEQPSERDRLLPYNRGQSTHQSTYDSTVSQI